MYSKKIENFSSDYQMSKNFAKILHLGGGFFIFIGFLLILYPYFQTDLIFSSTLIILGTYIQLIFKRSDPTGSACERFFNRIFERIMPVGIRPQIDLGGKKTLSTLINFGGLAIFSIGMYFTFVLYFSYKVGWGCAFLMLGIILITKFTSKKFHKTAIINMND
jgi:hypothetical protein